MRYMLSYALSDEPAKAKGPGEKIKCPDSGKTVDDVADCPNCPHRQGCPQWD